MYVSQGTLELRNDTYKFLSLLPPANEVWGKVKFLHLSVCGLPTGGGGFVYRGSA